MALSILPSQPYTLRLRKAVAPLSVLSWVGVESISQPYRLEIEFTSVVENIPVADVLGKPAQFLIEPIDSSVGLLGLVVSAVKPPERIFNGLITQFDQVSTTADQTHYRVVLEPRMADLGREIASRLFQNQTAPAIIEAVLRHYGYSAVDFQFKLRAEYESREYTTQYNESALAFIQRIAADEGIWFRFEQTDEREVLVFGDDLDAYARDSKLNIAWQQDAGLESVGSESIKTLSEQRRRVTQSITVDDYNHRTAGVALIQQANTVRADGTTQGNQYRWGEHSTAPESAQRFAALRHQAELTQQVVFEGSGNAVALTPGAVLRLSNRKLDAAEHGLLLTQVSHKASRQEAYTSTFTAIPSDRLYRTHVETISQPSISGVIPARVMSPDQYQYAYLTQQGWYRIQLPFDLDTWSPGGTSRPVRFAKPYAGRDYGHHFPLIDGTEVSLAFTEGDPDRPIIIGAMHDSQHGDHVTNQNNTRNIIRTAAQNELRMEDRRETEHIHLTTPYQTSELNLGHMVDPQLKERGQGAELRTDGHAAIRAAKGVFISADAQTNASGLQLSMEPAQNLLNQALEQTNALADATKSAHAIVADYEQQKALLHDTLKQLKQAGILLSAPSGVGLASGSHLQLSASQNLIATSGGNTDVSAIKKFTVAAGESISIFAQKLGMKIFASKGKVEIQAQSDEMNLASLGDFTVTSTNEKIVLNAKKEIWMGAGGSYIKITPTSIESGTPGEIYEKCSVWDKRGPSSAAQHFNGLQKTAFDDPFILRHKITGEPLKGQPYEIIRADGTTIKGITDSMGKTTIQKSRDVESVVIRVLPKLSGGSAA